MSLKELFTGGNEVKEAKEKIKNIEKENAQKGRLSKKDQVAQQRARNIISAQRQKLTALFGSVAIIGSAIGYCLLDKQDNETIKPFTPQSGYSPEQRQPQSAEDIDSLIKKTDRMIAKLENGILNLEQTIIPRLAKQKEPRLARYLQAPFDILRYNQINNPNRNHFSNLKSYQETGMASPKDSAMFAWAVVSKHDLNTQRGIAQAETLASFDPLTSSVEVFEEFDENNILHTLTVYHELVHACEINLMRQRLTPAQRSQYRDFFDNSKPRPARLVLPSEAMAIAQQTEILNLLLGGMLKSERIKGTSELDLQKILAILSLKDNADNGNDLMTLLYFAYALYPQGLVPGQNFEEKFLNRVKTALNAGQNVEILDFYPFLDKKEIINYYWPF